MYWLITCYDVLSTLHLSVRCVGTEIGQEPLEVTFSSTAEVGFEPGDSPEDILATIAGELTNIAYGRPDTWPDPAAHGGIPVSPDET